MGERETEKLMRQKDRETERGERENVCVLSFVLVLLLLIGLGFVHCLPERRRGASIHWIGK